MKKKLIKFLTAGVIGLGVLSASPVALAQAAYPTEVVRVIVGQAPGGSTDIIARIATARLSEILGKPVIVENRTGAAGSLAAEYVSKAKPDGHTLLLASSSFSINPAISKLAFDPKKDLKPVTLLAEAPFILVTRPDFPAKSAQDLLKMAAQKRIKYASGGVGSSGHMAGELLEDLSGLKMLHVPYKGAGPALNDVVAGHVDILFASVLSATPFIESGKLKPLAVSTAKRIRAQPSVPTLAEAGVANYRNSTWYGVLAPAGTPDALVERISSAFKEAVLSEKVSKILLADGAEPAGTSPNDFRAMLHGEMDKWVELVKKMEVSGMKN